MAKPESNAPDPGDAQSGKDDEASPLAQISVPLKQRASVSRLIDDPVPKQTFWDPANRETWHQYYPEMRQLNYDAFRRRARVMGEDFGPGDTGLWRLAMASFPPTQVTEMPMGGTPSSPPADTPARESRAQESDRAQRHDRVGLKRQRSLEHQQGGCNQGSKKSRTGTDVPALQTLFGKLM